MYVIRDNKGAFHVTDNVEAVKAAMDMDFAVYRNGKRVW